MRISDLRHESKGDSVTVSAAVAWEDCARPPETVSFEIEGAGPEEVRASPEAFAIHGVLAAFQRHERRVRVEAPLCPHLRDGLQTVVRTLKSWYYPDAGEPVLEAAGGFEALSPPAPTSALFLSGGSDSLAALRSNRGSFPPGHPAFFRVAIYVPTFGMRLEAFSSPRVLDLRTRQKRSIEEIARRTGLRIVSVRLQSGELGEDSEFATKCSHSARLASTAHLFSGWIRSVSIAATFDASYLEPFGSHPLLDRNYASSALGIRVEEFGRSREERLASIATWHEVFPFLLVCPEGPLPAGLLNCGKCEKCVRTMVALLLADGLGKPGPFPADVDAALLENLDIRPSAVAHWFNFPSALRRLGRGDLAGPIETLLARAEQRSDWFRDRGWKGRLRRLDRRFLGGRLLAARRKLA